jgi:molybdate transport system permease protein
MFRESRAFLWALAVLGGSYVLLIVCMVAADVVHLGSRLPEVMSGVFSTPEIRDSLVLSLITCTASAALSVLVGVPLGYLLAREKWRGRGFVEWLVDIPVVLPPLVVGVSLLILFHMKFGTQSLEMWLNSIKIFGAPLRVSNAMAGVILAQFSVAAAFAVRTLRLTFSQIPRRTEEVALTLGCTRAGAFRRVALPQARRGIIGAFTLAWARSLGEFGPIMIFAGSMRGSTEVLSTTVFLEMSIGRLDSAVAVSLLMIAISLVTLGVIRWLGKEDSVPV